MLLSAEHIYKYFEADNPIIEDVSFTVEPGDRIGLIGVNGCGKTTLLNIITGKIGFDPTPGGDGSISVSKNCRVGFLEQNSGMKSSAVIESEMRKPFSRLDEIYGKMMKLSEKMADLSGDELEKATQEYASLSMEYEHRDGYLIDVKINTVLSGMGFKDLDRSREVSSLSGGERTRLALCKLLLEQPDLLILDEPTNHLDLDSMAWLEGYLKDYKGAVLTVSHNRYFLDAVCTKIMELEDKHLKIYRGNYTAFTVQKKADLERQEKIWEQEQEKIARLQFFIDKNRVSATSAAAAKNKQHMLDRIVENGVEKPKKPKRPPKIRLEYDIEPPKEVFSMENVDITVGDGKTIIPSLSFEIRRGDRVGIIGPNGAGKSSILKTMQGINPHEHGRINWAMNVKIAYFDQKNEQLDPLNTVIEEVHKRYPRMTDQQVRTLLGGVLITGEDVYKPVGVISGGEKTKLSFALMTLKRGNVLILDEPTNHLDSYTCEALESALEAYTGTIVLVSHDRYLLNKIVTRIIEITPDGAKEYPGNYDSYAEAKKLEAEAEAEKKAQREAEDSAALKREQQRKQYRTREQRAKDAKRKQDIRDCEAKISELEQEISEIEEALCDPEIAADYVKCSELGTRLDEAKAELDTVTERWMELGEENEN